MIGSGTIVSVKEVLNELKNADDRLAEWAKLNPGFFSSPTATELSFVKRIFEVDHFQSLVREQERLQGKPVADPFVIARAAHDSGTVVTEESMKPNSSRIPNVCTHFGVGCTDLEGFMRAANWTF